MPTPIHAQYEKPTNVLRIWTDLASEEDARKYAPYLPSSGDLLGDVTVHARLAVARWEHTYTHRIEHVFLAAVDDAPARRFRVVVDEVGGGFGVTSVTEEAGL